MLTFINEYDSEKPLFFYGYGLGFLEENNMKFRFERTETESIKEKNMGSLLERLIEDYKNMKNLLSNQIKQDSIKIPESLCSSAQKRIKETHFKSDYFKRESIKPSISDDFDLKSPGKSPGKKTFTFEERYSSFKKSKIVKTSYLEEMILEMSDDLLSDYKKPRFSKLKYYVTVILISETIETEELQKVFELCIRLTLELPLYIKFVNMGNVTLEKLKTILSLAYKSLGDPGKKYKNKGVGIIDMKMINNECEKILTEVSEKRNVTEEDWLELRKSLLKISIFKGIPKSVVEYYYAENLIPIISKKESVSLK